MAYYTRRAAGYKRYQECDGYCSQPYTDDEDTDATDFNRSKYWMPSSIRHNSEPANIFGFNLAHGEASYSHKKQHANNSHSCHEVISDGPTPKEIGGRLQQILGQCAYMASMKGMNIPQIRQKLADDERQYRLHQKLANNGESEPMYYFMDPPRAAINNGRNDETEDEIYHSDQDELFQIYPETCRSTTRDGKLTHLRDVSSPTDFEEEEAEFQEFFTRVKRVQEKCDKIKAEDKSIESKFTM